MSEFEQGLFERDQGIARVLRLPWKDRAVLAFRSRFTVKGERVTTEFMRMELTQAGLDEPHSVNAWGALTMKLSRAGALEFTGESRLAARRKAHARRVMVWRVK